MRSGKKQIDNNREKPWTQLQVFVSVRIIRTSHANKALGKQYTVILKEAADS